MSQVTNTGLGGSPEYQKDLGERSKLEIGGVLDVLRSGSQKNYRAVWHLEHSQPIQRIRDLKADRKVSSQIDPVMTGLDIAATHGNHDHPTIESAQVNVDSAYDTSRGEG